MTSWQGVALQEIANELKLIREILEKQSTRVLTVKRSRDDEPAIVNLDHVACITPNVPGARIWFDTGEEDNLKVKESVIEILNKISDGERIEE